MRRGVSLQEASAQLARDAAGLGQRVIAMSLYGTDAEFWFGAIENAVLVKRDWPTWSLRIYHDNLVPDKMLRILRSLDVDLVPENTDVHAHDHVGHLWRFKVLGDANVTRYLVRDTDARLSKRDKRAVDEWIQSGLYFHVMRDHPQHVNEILAGMWGAVGGLIRPQMLEPVMKSVAEVPFSEDQVFLRDFVWPHVRNHTLTHDSYHCTEPKYRSAAWRPFPARRLAPQDFLGNRYDYANDFEGMATNSDCPEACRPHKDWVKC